MPGHYGKKMKKPMGKKKKMDKKKNLKGSIRVSIGTIEQMKRFWSVFKVIDKV